MIFLGADHNGFELKEKLKLKLDEMGVNTWDCGTNSSERCDFPIIVQNVVEKMDKNEDKAILICGSGIGMCMAANKFKGIRAGTCFNKEVAKDGKGHSDINCLCLPGQYISVEEAIEIIKVWLSEEFLGGRYQERLDMIKNIEENN